MSLISYASSGLNFVYSLLFTQKKADAPMDEEYVVVDLNGSEQLLVAKNVLEILNQATRPYAERIPVPLSDHTVVAVPKTWTTDVARSDNVTWGLGDDDLKESLSEEAAQRSVVQRVHRIAAKDLKRTETLLQAWSYRAKADLMNQIMADFQKKYEMSPVFNRGAEVASIRLIDAETVECRVNGLVKNATKETADGFDVVNGLNIAYTARVVYNFGAGEGAVYKIDFQ